MDHVVRSYDTVKTETVEAIQYLFISSGKADIIKAIRYQYVGEFLGRQTYNLGFGDYDVKTDDVSDEIISNNGDAYAVFITVLHTVPDFFASFPEAMMMVQGSDSSEEFERACRANCNRKCTTICRKRNRRIKIYRDYVNKNFNELQRFYTFYGGLPAGRQHVVESYIPGNDYDTVFLQKR